MLESTLYDDDEEIIKQGELGDKFYILEEPRSEPAEGNGTLVGRPMQVNLSGARFAQMGQDGTTPPRIRPFRGSFGESGEIHV